MPKITLNDKSIRRPAPETGQLELWDTYLPGFGLRISAGGARTYFAMRRVSGRMVRRSIGKAPPVNVKPGDVLAPGEFWPAEAREKARVALDQLARGLDLAGDKKEAARRVQQEAERAEIAAAQALARTFGAVAAAYFADMSKKGGGRLRSKAELERKVRVDLAGWKERPVESICKEDVKAIIKAKAVGSPVAANRLLALIRRILRWAAREDYIATNPAWEVDQPTEEDERDRVLSPREIAKIWAAADVVGHPFGPIVKLLILTAQRRGEVAGMRWAEIDGAVWRLPDERAKRGKGHLVPLSPLAVALLAGIPRTSDLVFDSGRSRSEKPNGPSGWSRAKKILDAEIMTLVAKERDEPADPERDALASWTLHDIRRSVATHLRDGELMGDDRVERLVVSKILNHAEGGMTRIYDRYSADPEKRAALNSWSTRVERFAGLNVVSMANHRSA